MTFYNACYSLLSGRMEPSPGVEVTGAHQPVLVEQARVPRSYWLADITFSEKLTRCYSYLFLSAGKKRGRCIGKQRRNAEPAEYATTTTTTTVQQQRRQQSQDREGCKGEGRRLQRLKTEDRESQRLRKSKTEGRKPRISKTANTAKPEDRGP
jgi:hypothetical protein